MTAAHNPRRAWRGAGIRRHGISGPSAGKSTRTAASPFAPEDKEGVQPPAGKLSTNLIDKYAAGSF